MIAPEVRPVGNGETSRLVLLRNNLLVSALIFLGLQIWRPHFFSTDDNLDGGLPFFSEMGHRLLAGRSPFFSDYLFGGHYNLARDPIFFLWHPLYFVVSLLAGTPFPWLIMDVNAFVLLMLTSAGFVNLAWFLRRDLALPASDGWIMFLHLSFTYSMIALATGAGWLNFLGNLSAMPWLALGILQRGGWRGMWLIALFGLHGALGGHLQPTISGNLFFTLFALAVSVSRRSVVPARSWILGNAIAFVVILPFLVPAASGFLASARSHGVEMQIMQDNNIPAKYFAASLFLGSAFWLIHPPDANLAVTYTLAMGSCGAAWCLLPALAGRPWNRLEFVVLGLMAFIALFIARPLWLSEIMVRLPLIRSLRWPFREFLQFQFFFHLFLLLRRPAFNRRIQMGVALVSVLLFLPPMLMHQPPTLARMEEDRRLLFSGAFDAYWDKVRPLLQPGERVAVLIPPKLYLDENWQKPYSLLGSYNYASLARIKNVWGWSQTPPEDQYDVKTLPLYVFGAYTPEQRGALSAEDPAIRFISLESLQPLKITLSSRTGPPIDLTPYIPAAYRRSLGRER